MTLTDAGTIAHAPALTAESDIHGNALDFLSQHVADDFPCPIDRCGWHGDATICAVLEDGTVRSWTVTN